VAQALAARGHAVAMLTATAYRRTVGDAGVTYLPPRESPDRDYDDLAGSFPALRHLPNPEVLARLFGSIAVADAPAQGHDVVTASAGWRPDVLINDGIALGVPLAAGLLRLPWATASPFIFCTMPAPDVAPPFLGVPRQPGRPGRLSALALNRAADLRLTGASRRWRALAAAWKSPPPYPSVRSAGISPLLYLYPGGPPLEYPRGAWPPQAHGVGPLLPAESSSGPPVLTHHPRIFLTEGTTHNDRRLSRLALQALGDAPVDLVIALGDRDPNADLGPLPANSTTVGYVNYREALRGAALLITNGGAGSLAAALGTGVPSLILPAGLDKGEAAQRLAWAGAGLRLPPAEHCSPERFRAGVLTLIRSPSYRQRAESVGRALLALGGAPQAAAFLERLITPSPGSARQPHESIRDGSR
jgi:UDP:flavonoid glycosyltransferase YjiC (YdhE family)